MAYNNRAVALGDPGRFADLKKALKVAPAERLPRAKGKEALQRARPEEGGNL